MKQIIVLTLFFFFTPLLKSQDCNKPFAISFLNNSQDSITIKWLQSGSPILGYQLAYGLKGTSVNNAIKTDTISQKSFNLNNLNPATQYVVFVRTICALDKDSGWNGPFAFTTHFNNPTDCNLNIALQDENCNFGGETFIIDIESQGDLGSDIFIESIDLLLEHPWLADMEIIVENPAGSQAVLSQFNGAAQNNFGIINDLCDTLTRFSSNACVSIKDGVAPFIGVYSPITSLVALNDGTPANGLWKIHFCDRSSGDKGILKQLKLNLTPQLCEPIVDFYVSNIEGSSVTLNWTAPFNCESILIEYGPEGFQQGVGVGIIKSLNCKKEFVIIDNLSPLTSYDFYLLGDCITSEAAPSCKSSFTTDCDLTSIRTNFDDLEKCQNSCAIKCDLLDDMWSNDANNATDWLVWNQFTDTDNTGPTSDVNRSGNYIYVESSPDICGEKLTSTLTSNCLFIGEDPGCGIGFYYHMEGNDQGILSLQISDNFGASWQSIFNATSSIGWERAFVNLDEYINEYATFRFVANTSDGVEGDIGLDQIDFHGTVISGENLVYLDNDNDGYGVSDSSMVVCGPVPSGFALNNGDCNDNNEKIHPGIPEIGCNAIDENCNGFEDDNLAPPTLTITEIMSESCFGLEDGVIDLSVEGIGAPYTVKWNNGMEGNKIENLPSGFYRATITDVTSCADVTPFYEVPVESKINIELVNIRNSACTGRRDGEITILPTGGVEPYAYEWAFDQIQATVIGLIEGDYTVTVTDAEGCTKISGPYHVGVDKPLNVGTTLHKNVSCYGGADGKLEINTSNGITPYNYKWGNGSTSNSIDQLSPGIYNATVTDKIGCQAQYTSEITQPDSLHQVLLNIETIKCHGDKNGKIKTTTLGGVPPFTYQWNSGHTTDDIFGLESGEYILNVFDNNGCTSTLDTVVLDEPSTLSLEIDSITHTTCRLSNDGAIYLSMEGGITPYSYFWRRLDADSLIAQNVFAGNYGFTGIDRNECKISLPGIDISYGNKPSDITLDIIKPFICPNEENGMVEASINSNANGFNFNWNNGISRDKNVTVDTIRNLGSGNYKLTITDNQGCVSISPNISFGPIELFSHTIPTFKVNTCPYDSLGIIGVDVKGGTSPYEYNWSNQKNTPAIGKLPNGYYHLTITDDKECTYLVENIEMYSTSNLDALIEITPTQIGQSNGEINISPINGIPTYQIMWSDTVLNAFHRKDLAFGSYYAIITDQEGCIIDTTIIVDQVSSTSNIDDLQLIVYPNPTDGPINFLGLDENVDLKIYNIQGDLLQSRHVNNRTDIDISNYLDGVYLLKITNSQGLVKVYLLLKSG